MFFGDSEGEDLKETGVMATAVHALVQTILVPFYSIIFIASKFYPEGFGAGGCSSCFGGSSKVDVEKEGIPGEEEEQTKDEGENEKYE